MLCAAKTRFFDSITYTYENIKYIISGIVTAPRVEALEERFSQVSAAVMRSYEAAKADAKTFDQSEWDIGRRFVYHTAPESAIQSIVTNGLRVSQCKSCPARSDTHDSGWFGLHTMGVYVSKHADYTFWYWKGKPPVHLSDGKVIVLECIVGRKKEFAKKILAAPPTPGMMDGALPFIRAHRIVWFNLF